ncbi:MAG: 4a-hydroxytetrahydrobiopterin dehydratase, partial [Actinobacteria bacterium]|nr:4a-hydroxytetrahydrobiopterin dehydratase [Actinomycetota bacterium]
MSQADLAAQHCAPCVPGTLPLDEATVKQLHALINAAWELQDDRIERRFKFEDFSRAFAFATQVALLAESEGHHPDLKIGWGYTSVSLKTHAAKGLTDNDFIMA